MALFLKILQPQLTTIHPNSLFYLPQQNNCNQQQTMGATEYNTTQLTFDGNAQAPQSNSWWLGTSWFTNPTQPPTHQPSAVGGAVTQNRFNGNCAIPSFQLDQYRANKPSQSARRTEEDIIRPNENGKWEFNFETWTWVWKSENDMNVKDH
eukprot:TRINITY_DN6037_c0_g2_i1.p2 TRINITY_DN6037_c0_g2~~TRINITY_DN6037_c0_g2_i1.p2  ORF type:complete len:151 (+),score=6.75 TRINITY_DN6037_c0_g2_i1:68-520(+)